MALTTASALLLAGGAFSATSQIMGAQQQAKAIKQQAEFNAQVYDQQAAIIQEKKKIQDVQFAREAARARGSIIARTAGKGLLLSGSPAAILADTESQMLFDKAIADYNLEIDRNYALSGAGYYRRSGAIQSRLARFQGYTGAFSTILNTGANMAMMNYLPKRAGKL
jgi:hypothetical protein